MYKSIIALMFMTAISISLSNNGNILGNHSEAEQTINQKGVKHEEKECPQAIDHIETVLEDVDFGSDYTRESYFANLLEYSAYNSMGSCGYVSLIQAMSYYDTFFNDDIIPEQYDRSGPSKDTFEEAKAVSPGVKREEFDYYTYGTYENFCYTNMDDDLQCKLTVIYNEFTQHQFFEESIGGWDYQRVLNKFYQEFNSNINVTVVDYQNGTNAFFEQKIKEIIDSGHPAIVHVMKNPDTIYERRHSVVAYEYDENGIWTNFGLYDELDNHQLLIGGDYRYTDIYGVFYLDYSDNNEVHSNNYVVNNIGWCGCNVAYDMVVERGTNSSEEGPILYWRKDYTNNNQWFRLDIYAGDSPYSILYWQSTCNKITIGFDDWNWIIEQSAACPRYLRFELQSFTEYSLETTCVKYFLKPNAVNLTEVSLGSHSYGFEQAYYSDVRVKNHTINNVNFTTERLRCGLIQGEKINLSARKKNEGSAYLEFYFEQTYIEHIALDISLWSNEEMINASNATIYIKYVNNYGNTVTLCDLFNDITISADRNNQNHLEFDLPIGVRTFGIYSTAEAVGTKNKGRVSIGDVVFQTYPDTVTNYQQ